MENKYRDLNGLPMTLRVEDLMPILGIGRNTAYELIRSRQIRSVRCWSFCGSKPLRRGNKTCTTAARDISWRWYIPRGGKERICRVQKQEKEPVVPVLSEKSQQQGTEKPIPTGRAATRRASIPAQASRSSAASPERHKRKWHKSCARSRRRWTMAPTKHPAS